MATIFDGESDEEFQIKTNNEYAKNYNNWRQKEMLNHLKTKYGEIPDDSDENSSSSSDDDEDDVELPEQMEKDFYKTLAKLKNKDPAIYDSNVKFFDDTPIDTSVKKKHNTEKPVFLRDYERKMLLDNADCSSNDEQEDNRPRSPTYVEEQNKLKKNLKEALSGVDNEDEENEWGGLFKTRQKTKAELEMEEADYKQWLKGQKESLGNVEEEQNLKPLKEYWDDPNLDAGEKFLRDYILNKKFLEPEDKNYIPTYDEIVHDDKPLSEDEAELENQEEFETKYNFRFEEEDKEFIKRYPRTMEDSLRRPDDRRKIKRQEVKERKALEKREKMEDIRKLKEIKRKEIEEKLKTLKEITGNTEVAFGDEDIDGDFDPDEHDKRMKALFDIEFYQGQEEEEKPEFPELDDELELERWDTYNPEKDNIIDETDGDPHCEDENFNMDCDYEASTSTQNELIENSKGKKKRRRKSKFAKVMSEPKPDFNPDEKSFEEYYDELYKLDCEDIIGDIPCRFKYRKVIPNSYGLTIDEILRADDRELNKWVSLRRIMKHRPDHVEKYDQIAFHKKAQNEFFKRKILPSLYKDENSATETTQENSEHESSNVVPNQNNTPKITKKLKEETPSTSKEEIKQEKQQDPKEKKPNEEMPSTSKNSIKEEKPGQPKKKKKKETTDVIEQSSNDDESQKSSINAVKKPKAKEESPSASNATAKAEQPLKKKKKKAKKGQNNSNNNSNANATTPSKKQLQKSGKRKRINSDHSANAKKAKESELSDARLKAFGINAKRFKNKIKYGPNNRN